jgi:sugar lactone lactonase YvrE
MTGALAPNHLLRRAERLALGKIHGPEDVAVDAAGRIYGGTADGRIVRVTLQDGEERVETFARTGGRPLGLHFDAAGNLVVADGRKGLLSIDPAGRVTVLATQAEGVPFGFTDDVKIASDGVIYFSDASSRFGVGEHLYDLLEARPHGRLLAWDPASRTVRVLLRGLYFANGVALSRGEDFVLVNETYRFRIRRLWLKGPRKGTADVFADNLPGYPDGVAADGRGTFWVAMFTVRNPVADRLQPRPWAKRLLSKLPSFLWPRPEPYGLVLAFDERGRLLRSLHDPGGQNVSIVTSVQPEGEVLYLGTLSGDWIGRYRLR